MFICLQKRDILPGNQLKLSAICSTAVLKTFYKKTVPFITSSSGQEKRNKVNSLSSISKFFGVSLQRQKIRKQF